MKAACEKAGIEFYYPSPIFCTDNAAMIGAAGYYEYINGVRAGWDLNAVPLPFSQFQVRNRIQIPAVACSPDIFIVSCHTDHRCVIRTEDR